MSPLSWLDRERCANRAIMNRKGGVKIEDLSIIYSKFERENEFEQHSVFDRLGFVPRPISIVFYIGDFIYSLDLENYVVINAAGEIHPWLTEDLMSYRVAEGKNFIFADHGFSLLLSHDEKVTRIDLI